MPWAICSGAWKKKGREDFTQRPVKMKESTMEEALDSYADKLTHPVDTRLSLASWDRHNGQLKGASTVAEVEATHVHTSLDLPY